VDYGVDGRVGDDGAGDWSESMKCE